MEQHSMDAAALEDGRRHHAGILRTRWLYRLHEIGADSQQAQPNQLPHDLHRIACLRNFCYCSTNRLSRHLLSSAEATI